LEHLQRGGNVEAAIQQLVAAAPPLTDDQRARISALLRIGGTATPRAPVPRRPALRTVDEPEPAPKRQRRSPSRGSGAAR
jgi:hypothetical protein